jgi:hypothetical protein
MSGNRADSRSRRVWRYRRTGQDQVRVREDLTAGEFEQLRVLLQRFAERHLDQFENLRFETSYGPVFVMTRELPPGWPSGAFTAVPRPAPFETGRFANVRDPASVTSREDLLHVINAR